MPISAPHLANPGLDNCKRLGGDPFAYLKDVLERLPTHPIDRLAELLPDAWFAAHPRARRKITS